MEATDIGHGRGWLTPAAAASIARIDAQLGRPVQITEAGRSAEDADKNRAAWIAYQNGTGPKAPYALGADESVHCRGEATDSDDADAPWEENGWIQTARYDDPDRDEPWHREYIAARDQHRNDPTPTTTQEESDMSMTTIRKPDGSIFFADELGADHLGDYRTHDIDLGEFLGSVQGVFGAPVQLNARQFDIAVAVAQRRWDRKRAQIVADVTREVVKALKQ